MSIATTGHDIRVAIVVITHGSADSRFGAVAVVAVFVYFSAILPRIMVRIAGIAMITQGVSQKQTRQ